MLYSIYDKQTGSYLNTGRNSTTKKEAIDDGINYMLSDMFSETDEKYLLNRSLEEKETYLKCNELFIDEHEIALPESTF